VVPYLEDMDEGVRYAALETLLRQADEAAARAPLLGQFVKEDSLRLRLRIADGFAELGWPIADRRAEVEKVLPDVFQIEAKGADVRIKRKPGTKE
jgi:HEAT repeat protein